MHAHPSLFCSKFKSVAMRSAHESAAYLRQRPRERPRFDGGQQRDEELPGHLMKKSEGACAGARRNRCARKKGSSLPGAAAAAALINSAAARRTERHRRATSRQPKRTKAADLMKRLVTNTHAHAFSLQGSSSA